MFLVGKHQKTSKVTISKKPYKDNHGILGWLNDFILSESNARFLSG